jgi:hypothetical protein
MQTSRWESVRKIQVVNAMFFCIFFLPYIPLGGGLPEVRPEWLLLAFFFPLFARRAPRLDGVGLWLLMIGVFMLLSMAYGVIFLGVNFGVSDVFELLKPALYLGFYAFMRSLDLPPERIEKLIRLIIGMMGVVALIAVAQYLDKGNILLPFLSIYNDPELLDAFTGLRSTATMGNPNDLGMLFAFGFSLSLFFLRHKVAPRKLDFLFLILMLVGTITTGSRTALAVVILIVLVYMGKNLKFRKSNLKGLVALGALILSGAFLINTPFFAKSAERFFLSGVAGDNEYLLVSWLQRIEGTQAALRSIFLSPFMGWGPNKDGFLGGNVDNEYILVLYRYGGVGMAVFLMAFYKMWRATRMPPGASGLSRSYSDFITATLIGAAAFAYAAGVFHVFQIMTILIILIGLGSSLRRRALEGAYVP